MPRFANFLILILALMVWGCLPAKNSNSLKKDKSSTRSPAPQNSAGPFQDKCELSDDEAQRCEIFTQQAAQVANTSYEILWVIDDSGSMQEEQSALAKNFATFASNLATRTINFKMAILTTDPGHGHINRDAHNKLNSQEMAKNKNQFIANFKQKIQVGIKGSGREKGLRTSRKFLNENSAWFDSNAYLVAIYVSDEDDHSCSSNYPGKCPDNGDKIVESAVATHALVSEYWNDLSKGKKSKKLFKAFAIVNKCDNGDAFDEDGNPCRTTLDSDGHKGNRYIQFAKLTGGAYYDLRGDFQKILEDLGKHISILSSSFALQYPALENTIEVYVNGVLAPSTDWEYVSSAKAIQFRENAPPPPGSSIKITYQTL